MCFVEIRGVIDYYEVHGESNPVWRDLPAPICFYLGDFPYLYTIPDFQERRQIIARIQNQNKALIDRYEKDIELGLHPKRPILTPPPPFFGTGIHKPGA